MYLSVEERQTVSLSRRELHRNLRSVADEKPVEVFYNSACPVCDAGVGNQRRAMETGGACELAWTDMTGAPEALSRDGLTLEHVRRHLYARDASGSCTAAPMPSRSSGRPLPAAAGSAG